MAKKWSNETGARNGCANNEEGFDTKDEEGFEIDDGRPLKFFVFDQARADERDLVGFGAMKLKRQDIGRPVTALAVHEGDNQLIICGCENTSVRRVQMGAGGAPADAPQLGQSQLAHWSSRDVPA